MIMLKKIEAAVSFSLKIGLFFTPEIEREK
jgi:hypothetical protein